MTFSWDELERLRGRGEWTLPIPPTCRKCSYILIGLPTNRCPECGTTFKWSEVRRRGARAWSAANRLRHANQDARMGLKIGLIGWSVLGLVHLLDLVRRMEWLPGHGPLVAVAKVVLAIASQISPAVDCLAAMAAIFVMVLGAQVYNIRRVPPSVRPYVGDPKPNMMLGTGTTACGLLLLVGATVLSII
jgi:hypothetical protein